FDAVIELFPDAQTDEERKYLLGVAERLARHDLSVWQQVGPYVQTVLVQKACRIDLSQSDLLRPVLLEVLGEALKAEVHGAVSTYNSVTLRQGSAIPGNALTLMRGEAIRILTELYHTAPTQAEKRRTQLALFEATHTPSGSGYANELLVAILDNSAAIM